jgi:hypothetical protein
LSARFS